MVLSLPALGRGARSSGLGPQTDPLGGGIGGLLAALMGATADPEAAGRAFRARGARAPGPINAGPGRGGPVGTGRGPAEGNPRLNAGPDRGGLPGTGRGPAMDLQGLAGGIGGGGGAPDFSGRIAGSYDAEAAALRRAGGRMGDIYGQLIGNINASSNAAQGQIGGFFDYAQGQAHAGRPVIEESYGAAKGDVTQTYDDLAGKLAALPQQQADLARAAGGSGAGSTVADRVAIAAAPFAAAGESSRAATQANLSTHSTAGKDYLTQLGAAAPSEAALAQSAVAGRANQAVTSAQIALAQQQAQIEAQVARIEGAKQRALAEYAQDAAGSTQTRAMDALKFMQAQQGLEKGELDIALKRKSLAGEPKTPVITGLESLDAAVSGDRRTAAFTPQLLEAAEQSDMDLGQLARLLTDKPRKTKPGFLGFGEKHAGGAKYDDYGEWVKALVEGVEDATFYAPGVDPRLIQAGWRGVR